MKELIKLTFNSLQEMSEWIERTPRTKRGEACKDSINESAGYYDFSGTKTYSEADNLLKFGDNENAEKIQAAAVNVKVQAASGVSDKNRLYNSPCGFLPIVPRVLAGVPENMLAIRKEAYRNTKVLNIIYNVCVSGKVSTDDIINTSAKVASAIRTLEKSGYRVNLFAADFTRYDDVPVCVTVKIKDAGQYFDGLRVAYPLVNPSFLRRHIFAVHERVKGIYLNDAYGKVLRETDAYIPKDMKYLSFYKCKDLNVEDIIKSLK